MRSNIDRFWLRVTEKGDCLEWDKPCKDGYGQFSINRKSIKPHRYSFVTTIGEIPTGLVLDHLCKNKLCVNPNHLEPVTQLENVLRGDQVQKKKSGLPPGVIKHRRKYKVRKTINGVRKIIGFCSTPEEAGILYETTA